MRQAITIARLFTCHYTSWVHPSVRDAVIEYLMVHDAERTQFISTASIDGCLLSLSSAGGASGERRLPLLVSARDWSLLSDRLVDLLVRGSARDRIQLMAGINSIWLAEGLASDDIVKLREVTKRTLEALRSEWDDGSAAISFSALSLYFSISSNSAVFLQSPNLDATWEAIKDEIVTPVSRDLDGFEESVGILLLLEEHEMRYLKSFGYPYPIADAFTGWVAGVSEYTSSLEHLDEDEADCVSFSTPNDGDGEVEIPVEPSSEEEEEREYLDQIDDILRMLPKLRSFTIDSMHNAHREVKALLDERETRKSNHEEHREEDSSDYGEYSPARSAETFDVVRFFADL